MTPTASRRSFLRMAGLSAAALPIMSEGRLAYAARAEAQAAAAVRPTRHMHPEGAVMINANENPLGPCASALAAIDASARTGGRYDAHDMDPKLTELFASQNGLKPENVFIYAGSSEPLHFSVLAFTSPTAAFVTADPSYEAGMYAATANHAPIIKVPLTPTYAHDVKAMLAAGPTGGVFYICNPNNPTGTLTPKEDIAYLVANKPAGSIVLIDEAYIHLAGAESCLDMVAAGKDVIVLRTFSKVYGMAGIRCGVAAGRPDLLAKLQRYGMNPLPITAVTAAYASLQDAALVPTRRKIIADTRNSTFAWLKENNYKFIPSVSNCFMIDTGRPGKQIIAAMAAKNVMIGRTWPIWPNYVRISVGTPAEMAAFQTAFKEVMSS
jgi:histidinol-phosphate aminotransferase